jgi:peptidoglycan L-alanyl-D-glutamate endopeptidase CwlK
MIVDPEQLHPKLQPIWVRFMRLVRAGGDNPRMTFAYRSRFAQDRLWEIGRRGIEGERIVTNARGGESWHNVERDGKPASLALDVAMLTRDGRAILGDTDEAWERMGRVAESLGLTWGGRWKMRDLGHLQLDDGGELTLAAAMAGQDPARGDA